MYSIQTLCGFCQNELHSCSRGRYSERRGSNVSNYHRGPIIEKRGAPDWSFTPLFGRTKDRLMFSVQLNYFNRIIYEE